MSDETPTCAWDGCENAPETIICLGMRFDPFQAVCVEHYKIILKTESRRMGVLDE